MKEDVRGHIKHKIDYILVRGKYKNQTHEVDHHNMRLIMITV